VKRGGTFKKKKPQFPPYGKERKEFRSDQRTSVPGKKREICEKQVGEKKKRNDLEKKKKDEKGLGVSCPKKRGKDLQKVRSGSKIRPISKKGGPAGTALKKEKQTVPQGEG